MKIFQAYVVVMYNSVSQNISQYGDDKLHNAVCESDRQCALTELIQNSLNKIRYLLKCDNRSCHQKTFGKTLLQRLLSRFLLTVTQTFAHQVSLTEVNMKAEKMAQEATRKKGKNGGEHHQNEPDD